MSALRAPHSALRTHLPRDPRLRELYARAALAEIPRLLGSIDRNPFRATHGSFDRQFWHYRTAAFPSEMYQEAVLPLALVYATPLPENRWHRAPRLRELCVAALRFSASSAHRDGSCDDYYPFERALGAAVFSLNAAAEAYRLLELDDAEIRQSLAQRARWIARHGESGTLTNHHALAALALERVARLTGLDELHATSREKVQQVLGWQSEEGWFAEYGGADPGYQTVTIDCLAKLRTLTHDERLNESLCRAVRFARHFLHPDGSYGGEYGSRGTYHFYPHGFELLAGASAEAADLADGFLRAVRDGRQAHFADDRMVAHRLGNLIEAYRDWTPRRPTSDDSSQNREPEYLPHAQLLVDRADNRHTIVSAARGGVVKHFVHGKLATTDTGLIVETADGRIAVSNMMGFRPACFEKNELIDRCMANGTGQPTETRYEPASRCSPGFINSAEFNRASNKMAGDCPNFASASEQNGTVPLAPAILLGALNRPEAPTEPWKARLTIVSPLCWASMETATPLKQAALHLGMVTIGRWCRTWVRRFLQRRVITGRAICPITFERTVELLDDPTQGLQPLGLKNRPTLRITDRIVLTDPRLTVRRMSFTTDLEPVYVAASGVYQESVLQPWTALDDHVSELNRCRETTVVRTW